MNSPTKGKLSRESDTPTSVASQYLRGGAQALSVLTEPIHFEGSLSHLESIRAITETTPIMCKDFILDKIQIQEARTYGADGVLLITHLLTDSLPDFLEYAKSVGMWALVETRSKKDVESALKCGAEVIGVNNRDLATSNIDLNKTIELCTLVPEDKKFVVESGVNYPEDIRYLRENCRRKPDAYLVGTALMTAKDRTRRVKDLIEA
jgi:indole-3-glycerol phosphate synthase